MNTPTVTIRMPAETRAKLDELARARGCTRQDLILESVQLWLQARKPNPVYVPVVKVKVAGTDADRRRWWHPRWSTKKRRESTPALGVVISSGQ